jgi:streptogramin lyase
MKENLINRLPPWIRSSLLLLSMVLTALSPAVAEQAGRSDAIPWLESLGWIDALPDGTIFEPVAVGIDFQGHILVLEGARRGVLRFSSEENLLGRFGRGGGQRAGPSDLTGLATYRGFVTMVVDRGLREVVRYDRHGAQLPGWDLDAAVGEGFVPWGITVGDDGNVYLTDPVAGRIVVLASDGTLVREIRDIGSDLGGFVSPGSIAIHRGFIYFTDVDNDRVMVLNRWGRFDRTWGSTGREAGLFRNPRGIAIDTHSRVWVADADNGRIQLFSAEGEFIARFPDDNAGTFVKPEAVAIGPEGLIFIVDTGRRGLFRGRLHEAPDKPDTAPAKPDTAKE